MIYFVTNEQDNFDCLTSGVSKHTCFFRARAKNFGNLPKRAFGLTLVTWLPNSGNPLFNPYRNLTKENILVKSGQKGSHDKVLNSP